ncbi:hypothetical protein MKK64_23755 [Methylobacterium sp. E-025]|uniref:hypothetical protein n=1 Tax=Methylobacterium sp. E-025 TaxID=2836561 RepID=UPI001FB8C037|nr:hypothetical protein [Methylobacterium sp. E-025]MCJ2114188.1 hypothetical protein [Methylobacterium sp. E-025]
MVKLKGRRRLTCHHEAGHALVRWYFGYDTDKAVVLTVEELIAGRMIEDRQGNLVTCEGLVDGYDIIGYPFGPRTIHNLPPGEQDEFNRCRAIARDIEFINCLAGIYAEARYRKMSAGGCMFSGGLEDMKHFKILVNAWKLPEKEQRAISGLAEARAAALVRSPMGSAGIRNLADLLMEHGEVDGEKIAAVFRQAYGGRQCAYGAWDAHWPPTLIQIQDGFVP